MCLVKRTLTALLGVVSMGVVMSPAFADGGSGATGGTVSSCRTGSAPCRDPGSCRGLRCHDCGCAADCCKVCRLVCKPKKAKVTCWKSECDPFCVPGPSQKGPAYVECVNGCEDGKRQPDGRCHGCLKKVAGFHWCPGDAKVANKKKLLKQEKEVELKGVFEYKWEIVDLCAGCKEKSEAGAPAVDPSAEIPPAPRTDAHPLPGQPPIVRAALLDN